LPKPNASFGSRRHSIITFIGISQQAFFRDFDGDKLPLKDQIADMLLTDVDGLIAAADEAAPEGEIIVNVLVAVEFHPTSGAYRSRISGKRLLIENSLKG